MEYGIQNCIPLQQNFSIRHIYIDNKYIITEWCYKKYFITKWYYNSEFQYLHAIYLARFVL